MKSPALRADLDRLHRWSVAKDPCFRAFKCKLLHVGGQYVNGCTLDESKMKREKQEWNQGTITEPRRADCNLLARKAKPRLGQTSGILGRFTLHSSPKLLSVLIRPNLKVDIQTTWPILGKENHKCES